MEHPALRRLKVSNFRLLADVDLNDLGPLNVLVGPNASGKSTVLELFRFLRIAAQQDLGPAIAELGGWDAVRTRDGKRGGIKITVEATVTEHSHDRARDEYTLSFGRGVGIRTRRNLRGYHVGRRNEAFKFKRKAGPGRRITLTGARMEVWRTGKQERAILERPFSTESLLLSTLQRLDEEEGGSEMQSFAQIFTTFRVFDIDVRQAVQPSASDEDQGLAHDASNLAAFLFYLGEEHEDVFARLVRDAKRMIPGLKDIGFRELGGAQPGVVVELHEHGLEGATDLGLASFGTVRTLALLAMLYDPHPPKLTCVEEIDHGLHPYLFDRLVELLREASTRTQFVVATHSPALVNRLRAEELIVCERDVERGIARIPAIERGEVEAMIAHIDEEEDALRLGELWFAGSLGGVPE